MHRPLVETEVLDDSARDVHVERAVSVHPLVGFPTLDDGLDAEDARHGRDDQVVASDGIGDHPLLGPRLGRRRREVDEGRRHPDLWVFADLRLRFFGPDERGKPIEGTLFAQSGPILCAEPGNVANRWLDGRAAGLDHPRA